MSMDKQPDGYDFNFSAAVLGIIKHIDSAFVSERAIRLGIIGSTHITMTVDMPRGLDAVVAVFTIRHSPLFSLSAIWDCGNGKKVAYTVNAVTGDEITRTIQNLSDNDSQWVAVSD